MRLALPPNRPTHPALPRRSAFFEFLKEDGGPDSREVYRRLDRFYITARAPPIPTPIAARWR